MKKFSVLLTVDASIRAEVEAENEEQAKEKALETANPPHVCHYCSRKVELGDIMDAVEAIEIERGAA